MALILELALVAISVSVWYPDISEKVVKHLHNAEDVENILPQIIIF